MASYNESADGRRGGGMPARRTTSRAWFSGHQLAQIVAIIGTLWLLCCPLRPALAAPAPRQPAAPAQLDPAARCQNLSRIRFQGDGDAPATILETKMVQMAGTGPAYCKVVGYVEPNIGFGLGLPTAWNGKFAYMGCGGSCGVLNDRWFAICDQVMRAGYACIFSDMGHTGNATDYLWLHNNLQAKLDYGIRSTHVAAMAGKAVTKAYYDKDPAHSYYIGCSTGGRQGMQEAQDFPWDFDGIIAGAPPVNFSDAFLNWAWAYRVTHFADGRSILDRGDLQLLTNAAIADCDKDDGLADGIIGRPLACKFDPARLACRPGQKGGCLNEMQIQAARAVYQGPTTRDGKRLTAGSSLPGSEFNPLPPQILSGDWSAAFLGDGSGLPLNAAVSQDVFRYLLFDNNPGPDWKLSDFDFDKDYKRFGVFSTFFDSNKTDMRSFRDAGGKLIIYSGANDNSVPMRGVADYYDRMAVAMGGMSSAQQFARLFVVPGMGHCIGGAGADTVDYIRALESWVERGVAPDRLVASHLKDFNPFSGADPTKAAVAFTRPLFPYPSYARYKGEGDPNDEKSFEAASDR
jgi:feruloyl esterase